MRVLVCGSRTWKDFKAIERAILNLYFDRAFTQTGEKSGEEFVVITGEARGADLMAKTVATVNDLKYVGFPANWTLYGLRAGPLRNLQMLSEGLPDLVLAFWDGVSRGTGHMIELATKAKIPVEVHLA